MEIIRSFKKWFSRRILKNYKKLNDYEYLIKLDGSKLWHNSQSNAEYLWSVINSIKEIKRQIKQIKTLLLIFPDDLWGKIDADYDAGDNEKIHLEGIIKEKLGLNVDVVLLPRIGNFYNHNYKFKDDFFVLDGQQSFFLICSPNVVLNKQSPALIFDMKCNGVNYTEKRDMDAKQEHFFIGDRFYCDIQIPKNLCKQYTYGKFLDFTLMKTGIRLAGSGVINKNNINKVLVVQNNELYCKVNPSSNKQYAYELWFCNDSKCSATLFTLFIK